VTSARGSNGRPNGSVRIRRGMMFPGRNLNKEDVTWQSNGISLKMANNRGR